MYDIGFPPSGLLRTRKVGRSVVVELCGEIDMLTAQCISVRLATLISGRRRPELVVDLRSVTFIDCSGLGALHRARNRVLERGGRLRLIVRCPRILRTLRLADPAGSFEVSPDLSGPVVRPAAARRAVRGEAGWTSERTGWPLRQEPAPAHSGDEGPDQTRRYGTVRNSTERRLQAQQ